MNPFSFLDGWKTYIAAAGLFGLALYQFSQGDFATAIQSLMAALAAVGVKHAIARNADAQASQIKLMKAHLVQMREAAAVAEKK
jgi:hypothetical protein